MKKNALAPIMVFLLAALLLSISTTVLALPAQNPVEQSSLPNVTFLGQGPATFTVEPPLQFLVKTYQDGEFLFVPDEGPEYTAKANERVWTIDVVPSESIRLFHEGKSFGNVEAGCVVNYVQIEDNPDTRRNTFFINGDTLQVVEQGWVTYGTFTVPVAGELTFYAEDSIGMVIELCLNLQTVVPSESPTPTGTAPGIEITLTATPSGTPLATETVPATATETTVVETPPPGETATATPTSTATAPGIEITLTATETSPPENTATNTPVTPPPPTATAPNVQLPSATPQVIQVTATPLGTPGLVPVTGGGPGPREIATISGAILGLFLLVGAGWVFLFRAYLQRR